MLYLSNGSVAWEVPEESALRYKKGFYHPPAGWFVLLKITKNARQASGGQWYPAAGEVFVDDRRIQAAATKILHKQRIINLVMIRRERHE